MERAQDLGANRVAALIAACRPGHALTRGFYLDPEVFERDLDLLLGRWTVAGHASDLAAPGDFLVV